MTQKPDTLIERIDAALARAGMSRAKAEKIADLGEGYIRKIASRGLSASTGTDNLTALAQAIGCPLDDLLADDKIAPARPGKRQTVQKTLGPDVPILGTANGSAIGAFQMQSGPIGHVNCPPGLLGVEGAYALYVRNDSMWPKHPQGDLVFVHPHKPPRIGDSVIVQTASPGGETEAFIKEYGKHTPEWYVFNQLNPAAELRFKADTVKAVHKVLTTAELFNA